MKKEAYEKYKDDPIYRRAFDLWHEHRLSNYEKGEGDVMWVPSIFTSFLCSDSKDIFIDIAKQEIREDKILKIIKK